MAVRRRKSTARRSRSNSSGRRSGAARRSYAAKSRSGSVRRTTRRTSGRSGGQTVRIVLETAGSQPVREGVPVGIGQKVAPAPRVKPRF